MKKTTVIQTEEDKQNFIKALKNAIITAPVMVETSLYKKKRSLAQNRLFHMWMNEISNWYYETHGEKYAPRYWKIYFKRMFLGDEAFSINGKNFIETRHTADLKTNEMMEMLEQIDIYCANEFSCILTHPHIIYDESMGL